MKNIFKDPIHQEEFDENGYIVIDFFSAKEVKLLLDYYDSLKVNKTGYHNFFAENIPEVSAFLSDMTSRRLNELLIEYRIAHGDFLVKEPSKNSSVMIHQDWNFVDESKYVGCNIWIPLVDTNDKNGAIYLMKKSHHLPKSIRGKNVPQPIRNFKTLKLEQLTYEPTMAGQAIIWDLRTIHASPPNHSNTKRIVCAVVAVPNNAGLLNYQYEHQTQTLSLYDINSDYSLGYKINNLVDVTFKEQTIISENQFIEYTYDDINPLLNQPKGWKKFLSFFNLSK